MSTLSGISLVLLVVTMLPPQLKTCSLLAEDGGILSHFPASSAKMAVSVDSHGRRKEDF